MTKKADFNADEWQTVVEGPLLSGLRVVASDRGGTIRESLAIGEVYKHAREQRGGGELIDELVSSAPALDQERVKQSGDIAAASGERLREALALLRQKASSEEVDAYRNFVMDVAEAAAKAHKEGGFIGIGGKQVSDQEQAALNEIQATLDAG
jgi:hypothetical protein